MSEESGREKKRTATEVKTGRGEQNLPLTISLTFWWATGARDDQKDREMERDGDREGDISCNFVGFSSSDLTGDCYKCIN